MISAINRDFLCDFLKTVIDEYPYYVAHTVSDDTNSISSNRITLKVYLSKKPFTMNGFYNYSVPSDGSVKLYEIRANNYTSNQSNLARMAQNDYSGNHITIPQYEFVYASGEISKTETGVAVPDLIYNDRGVRYEAGVTNILLILILLFSVGWRIFRGR